MSSSLSLSACPRLNVSLLATRGRERGDLFAQSVTRLFFDTCPYNELELQQPASLGLGWRDILVSGEVTVGAGLFCSADDSAAETSRHDYGDALFVESKASLPGRDFVLCL